GGAVTIVSPTGSAPQSVPSDKEKLKQLPVLVVDDDPATREAVAELLTALGAEVKTADSAMAAMTIIAEFKPKILLCDLAMPQEDGFAFISRLRALGRDRGGNIPALALTALAGDEDKRRALAAGFQMLMTKPFVTEGLIAAVVELAELAERREARQPGPRSAERTPAP
ncbi:MAG TPA: response regulator, partial [Polyangia bacterium]|nr:response regulator [Polyangia bacterium]